LHLTSPYQGPGQIIVGDGNSMPITHNGKTIFHTQSGVREAMKYPRWRHTIFAELDVLTDNGTWTLVQPIKGQNVVECKLLFIIKRNPNGSIFRYKLRLVSKGFTQCQGIVFQKTFAPIVRPQTIKIDLTLALGHSWTMHQLDVNNAFIQGSLREQIFMSQPPTFKNTQFPKHVCKFFFPFFFFC
jgi:hypothetical protein